MEPTVIIVRRLTGQQFAVNPDLLGRIECTPDTILVLVDGTRYLIDETLEEVIDLIRDYRASIVAQAIREPASPVVSAAPVEATPPVVPLPSPSKGT